MSHSIPSMVVDGYNAGRDALFEADMCDKYGPHEFAELCIGAANYFLNDNTPYQDIAIAWASMDIQL